MSWLGGCVLVQMIVDVQTMWNFEEAEISSLKQMLACARTTCVACQRSVSLAPSGGTCVARQRFPLLTCDFFVYVNDKCWSLVAVEWSSCVA